MVVLFLAGSFSIEAADDPPPGPTPSLRLLAKSASEEIAAFALEHGQIVVRIDQKSRAVPTDVTWTLEGDLRRHGSLPAYAFPYSIRRYPPVVSAPVQSACFAASVFLERNQAGAWPDRDLKDAIAVFVWLVNGAEKFVAAVPTHLKVDGRGSEFAAIHAFDLTEETASGVPLVLLWKDGGFIAPENLFADAEAQSCLAAMLSAPPGGAEEIEFARLSALANVASARAADGTTLVHLAAEAGVVGAIDRLLAAGAAPDVDLGGGETPLKWAAANGRRAAVHRLQSARQTTVVLADGVATPVDAALANGHIDLGIELLRHERCNMSVAAAIAATHLRSDLLTAALEHQNRNALANLPATAARDVIMHREENILEQLLAYGAQPNGTVQGTPLLLMAAYTGNHDQVRALLRAGAAVDASDEHRVSALMLAAQYGAINVAQVLIEAGASINAKNDERQSALHFAAAAGQTALVDLLLSHQAAPNDKNIRDETPLDIALRVGDRQLAENLLAKGAKIDLRSRHFPATLVRAICLDGAAVLRAAKSVGWKSEKPVFENWTPWDIAQAIDATEVMAWLQADNPRIAPRPSLVEAKPDQPPRAKKGGRPPDHLRRKEHDLPELAVRTRGIVDRRGRFLFPHVLECDDARLTDAIIQAVETWRFEPAQKAGVAMEAGLTVSITFPAWSAATYNSAEVDSPPTLRQAAAVDREYGAVPVIETSRAWVNVPTVEVRGRSGGIGEVYITPKPRYESVSTVGSRALETEGTFAICRCIVELDGKASLPSVVDTDDRNFAQAAVNALMRYEFAPATHAGRPVRAAITLTIRQ